MDIEKLISDESTRFYNAQLEAAKNNPKLGVAQFMVTDKMLVLYKELIELEKYRLQVVS